MNPLVTVIVPGRDVAAYVPEALASLTAQTLARWSALLVDDGSGDDTGALFDAAAAADDRFEVVRHATARGLGAARNAGLDRVRTPYVAFLDADDRYTPGALAALVGALEDSGSEVAVGAYVRLRPNPDGNDGAPTYEPGEVQPWVRRATDPARRSATLASHPDVSGNIVAWSKASRMSLWQRTGLRFPEGRLYEDQVVAQTMYVLARGIDVVPDVVVHWRERADGSSITQHADRPDVLADYLSALGDGLAVLDAAHEQAAADARVRLILEMDVPAVIRRAQPHPDRSYRAAVGVFVRGLCERAAARGIAVTADAAQLHRIASTW